MVDPQVLIWQGGEHTFALRLGELRALQKACDAGPEEITGRFLAGDWRVDDLFQTIRLGLIGGGMEAVEAQKITENAFESHGLINFKFTAQAILIRALTGEPDDPVGEPDGEATPQDPSGNSATITA